MKKRLLSLAVAVVMAALLATPALAHGSHRGRTARYSVCTTDGCTQTGLHTHSGRYYSAHYYGDGHNYHSYCTVEDCTLTGYHEHDGSYHFGHTANDGHSYHHTGRGRGHH